MDLHLNRKLILFCGTLFLAARIFAADTNQPAAVTRDDMANHFLQLQEQIHASQLALEQNQEAALETAQSNATALAQRLQSLEQSVAQQHASDTEAVRKTQQLTLLLAGAFGLIGLSVLLLLIYFQWRVFTQFAQIAQQQHVAIANADAVRQLAAPGRASVETANTQLLTVVSRLEQRINELESGQRLLPEVISAKPADLVSEGQKHLEANAPLKALECFDKFLSAHPGHAEALARRAAALEKLGRDDEALAAYDRAIAADGTQVTALLHKGGLLNRLRRYDEALNCYEQALRAQDKKAGAKVS